METALQVIAPKAHHPPQQLLSSQAAEVLN
jgi:hypothetical protein